jgi:predicted dehydrogenase
VRFGLIGTGYWARTVHGRSLADSEEVELAGVWGRDPLRTAAAASELGTRPFVDLDELLAEVDGLAFAVPPHVQAPIALRAARGGKHLLLEKPVATSCAAADELAAASAAAGVATAVFFTARFVPAVRDWLERCAGTSWRGAWAHILGAAFVPGSHFDTPWRRAKGGLWDVGPHAVSVLVPLLGPVSAVAAAARGTGDLVHLVLEHASGATSTVSLSIDVPKASECTEIVLWGDAGRSAMPDTHGASRAAARLALHELLERARHGGPPLACDVNFGAEVVRVLAETERRLGAPPGASAAG